MCVHMCICVCMCVVLVSFFVCMHSVSMLEFRYITVTVLGIALFYAQYRIVYILAICIIFTFYCVC